MLDVPVDHPVWCPDDHAPPLRVSGIQSGSWSGPVGSTRGQQRFAEGLTVTEEQPRFEGWLPASGHVEIRCAMDLSPRSMAALWMAGFEDDEEQLQCGELCVVEIFGNALAAGLRGGGHGHQGVPRPGPHPGLRGPRVDVDVSEFHTYAVDWDADVAVFTVDGEELRRCPRPPTYPLQLHGRGLRLPGGVHRRRRPPACRELVVDHVAGW